MKALVTLLLAVSSVAAFATDYKCRPHGKENVERLQKFLFSESIMTVFITAHSFSYDKATGEMTILTEAGLSDLCEAHADVTYCGTFQHTARLEINNRNIGLITPVAPDLVPIGNIALSCDKN